MFRNTRRVHFVAIGGIGMSGIAEIMINLGFEVTGSDLRRSAATDRLAALGARVHIGHGAELVEGADVVVYSSAVTEANPEIAAARRLRVPVIRRAEMLAGLMRLKYGITVSGSHGKTTTTSLIAAVLARGGLDPTVVVGGRAVATGRNAVLGAGDYLVAEADESDGSFLMLTPTIAVVTNIDLEHVDYYPDLDVLRDAFWAFLRRVPFYGTCVLCIDDAEVRDIASRLDRKVVTYGLSPEAQVRAEIDPDAADGAAGEVFAGGKRLGRLQLALRGRHNLQNALAAVAVGLDLGLPFPVIAAGLHSFEGVSRRCETHGEHGGVLVLDDYGHHPTEIGATLQVARSFGRRVAVLFQPHRYTRTQRFEREFADALSGADTVGLLPIYGADERPLPGVGSELILARLQEKGVPAALVPGPEAVSDWLAAAVRPGDLLLTLGAGDVGRLVEPICGALDARR